MSAVEVVAAVAAVISAFHTGAELVGRIKKRQRRRKSKQAYEEDQLEGALLRGESLIEERFTTDCTEIGQRFRVGDAIARDRLLHISVVLQAEIIRSLQIAAENENAILDLTVLHEASVLYRQDAIRILDELKQRLYAGMSFQRNRALSSPARPLRLQSSGDSFQNFAAAQTSSNFLPAAVTIPNVPEPKSPLGRLFARNDRSGGNESHHRRSFTTSESRSPVLPSTEFVLSPRNPNRPSPQLPTSHSPIPRTATSPLPPLQSPPPTVPLPPIPVRIRPPQAPPPQIPEYSPRRPQFRNRSLSSDLPSFYLDDKIHARQDSGHDGPMQYSSAAHMDRLLMAQHGIARHPSTSTSSAYSDDMSGPLASHRSSNSYSDGISPVSSSISPDSAYQTCPPSYPPLAIRPAPPPIPVPARANVPPPVPDSALAMSSPREATFRNNYRSSILMTTASNGPILLGRPCKDNNYWGFCKGSWALQEGLKKGLSVQTRPNGIYTSICIWQCKHCSFQGDVFNNGQGKKQKDYTIDRRLHTSPSGVRYYWMFLAKSHVKRKSSTKEGEENAYGCLFCCVEGKGTSIFGKVETLMDHISGSHSHDLTPDVQERTKCIWGRDPRPGEEFDIHIPPMVSQMF